MTAIQGRLGPVAASCVCDIHNRCTCEVAGVWHQGIFLLNNCRFIQISEWPSWSSAFFLKHKSFSSTALGFHTRFGQIQHSLRDRTNASKSIAIWLRSSSCHIDWIKSVCPTSNRKRLCEGTALAGDFWQTTAIPPMPSHGCNLLSLRPSSLQKASAKWQPPVRKWCKLQSLYTSDRDYLCWPESNLFWLTYFLNWISFEIWEYILCTMYHRLPLAPARILRPTQFFLKILYSPIGQSAWSQQESLS